MRLQDADEREPEHVVKASWKERGVLEKVKSNWLLYLKRGFTYGVYSVLVGILAAVIGWGAGTLVANSSSLSSVVGLVVLVITIPVFWIADGYMISEVITKRIF